MGSEMCIRDRCALRESKGVKRITVFIHIGNADPKAASQPKERDKQGLPIIVSG